MTGLYKGGGCTSAAALVKQSYRRSASGEIRRKVELVGMFTVPDTFRVQRAGDAEPGEASRM
ncbi:MAG: hypothetical protein H6672_13375 [Anaerolineaceae bacterium]|nr:hypothetical protein [Anaerolineaceae bacterium]